MAVARKAIVSGRVQGVFFRDTCRSVAQREGVAGSARNVPDGTVEVVLEGEKDAVERVLAWCRKGTEYAHVEQVDVTDVEPTGLDGFRIL